MSRKAEPGTEKRREYFPLYFSYGKRLASLTDEQMGIVVRAALQYAESGTIPELEPVCRLALDNIIYDIDRASSSYEDICRQNRENGEKGGRPKNGTEKPNGSSENRTVPAETEKTQYKDEYEDENENKENTASADADACAEPVEPVSPPKSKKTAPVDDSPVIVMLPLNDGTEFPMTENLAAEYAELYPAVDVPQQFRGMRAWSLGHPNKRKTKRGVRAFINSWLNREQNRPHPQVSPTPRVNAPPGMEDRDPFIAFMDAASRGEEWTG